MLISFAVSAKLICVFVFVYAKSRFSHDEAHMYHLPTVFMAVSLKPCIVIVLYSKGIHSDKEILCLCLLCHNNIGTSDICTNKFDCEKLMFDKMAAI